MTGTDQKVAEILLDVEAVKLSPGKPFKWSSGWNSPIYCDNRLTLSYPAQRTIIRDALVEKIRKEFPGVEAIAGVATAGIPQGALVADALAMPFVYVRAKAKGHGMENLIEGRVMPGCRTVLVEDLISTGGSSLNAAEALKKAGFEVLGLVAIFTYGFDAAQQNFREAGVPYHCLSNYTTLVEVALAKNKISEKELELLGSWREAPESWGI